MVSLSISDWVAAYGVALGFYLVPWLLGWLCIARAIWLAGVKLARLW